MSEKFRKAFMLFSSCHSVYSSRHYLSDDGLENLGKIHVYTYIPLLQSVLSLCACVLLEKRIDDFLTFYRQQFVGTSITPKLHMIEDHMVNFLREWRVGCGLLGEQGAESIHIKFNELHRNYSNIRNSVDRLRQVTLEHHRRTSPLLNCHRPLLQHKTRPEE